ncbi:uncharacterized protein LOC134738849 [Pongo pygmaeus]|uniref:uncharacterized protein LOC134738849 n=1 Tax=Pongo pygmaeus TaxID=9600 RepID=UPI00300D38AA
MGKYWKIPCTQAEEHRTLSEQQRRNVFASCIFCVVKGITTHQLTKPDRSQNGQPLTLSELPALSPFELSTSVADLFCPAESPLRFLDPPLSEVSSPSAILLKDAHPDCSTIHNSKHVEPTQIPINDRLDKENVAHIHHGILRNHKKGGQMSRMSILWKQKTKIQICPGKCCQRHNIYCIFLSGLRNWVTLCPASARREDHSWIYPSREQ